MKIKFINILFRQRKDILLFAMRVFIFLLCSTTFGFTTGEIFSQNTKIHIDKDQMVSIDDVFDLLREQTDYTFIYQEDLFKDVPKVQLKKGFIRANRLLETCFSGKDFKLDLKGNKIVIIATEGPSSTEQQTLIISGTVSDVVGQPLPGASIVEKGTSHGTQSDFDGKFSLEVASENATLVVSYLGFASKEVSVDGQTNIAVSLEEDAAGLEEVIVVGYGSMKQKDLTGSVVSISGEELKDLPNPNIMDKVQGRLPGLTIINSNAAPGSDPQILIRGTNSLQASNFPLIVMDGIPYAGSLSSITPSDVESLSVLKDASATAIYGSRGSNGVILVTTKKGRKGLKPSITLDSRVSFNSTLNKLDVLNAEQYVEYKGFFGEETGFPLQPSEIANLEAGRVSDWQDITTRTAIQRDNTLSIRGGGEAMSYFASASKLDQEGIVKGSEYNRTSIRLNGDYKINDWIDIGTQVMFSEEDWGDKPNLSQNLATLLSPLGKPYNDDGTNTLYPVPEDQFFENPLDILNNYRKQVRRRLQSNFYALIDLPYVDGLSYRLNYGRLEQRTDTDAFNPSTTLAGVGGGSASRAYSTSIDYTVENLLLYNRTFGDHVIDATALYSFQEATNDNSSLSDSGFVSDALTFYAVGSGENTTNVSAGHSQRNLISQMGRLNYGYKGKYNATYTVRRDGSSVFGANNKWATFHSGALTWTISEEDFLQNADWLDYMKLKASYGTSGNQAISPYQTGTRISRGSGYYFDSSVTSFTASNLANPNLRWESTESWNFGLEFNLLKNRLTGSIDLYKTTSNDLLRNKSLNLTQGFSSVISNIGSLENKGVEVSLNGVLIDKPDFSWDATVGFFKNKNKILVLDGQQEDLLSDNLFIGEDINVIFGYKYGGVYADQAEIDASKQPDAKPGDAIIVDVDGDGTITTEDRTIVGRGSPDWTMGITNTLSYKNFQLSAHIYVLEGERTVNNFVNSRFWGQGRFNYPDIDFWTPNNTDAKYPRPVFVDDRTRILEDRDYMRLKNITLGYTFSKPVLDRIGLSNLRLYIAGNNLMTVTDWSGKDPETLVDGGNLGEYPSAKSFVFGASIGL